MLTLKKVEVATTYRHGYNPGAKPGYGCTVEFQHGEHSYDTIKLELPAEAVRRVVELAVEEAMALIRIDPASIDVEGKPGDPTPDAEPAGDPDSEAPMRQRVDAAEEA